MRGEYLLDFWSSTQPDLLGMSYGNILHIYKYRLQHHILIHNINFINYIIHILYINVLRSNTLLFLLCRAQPKFFNFYHKGFIG